MHRMAAAVSPEEQLLLYSGGDDDDLLGQAVDTTENGEYCGEAFPNDEDDWLLDEKQCDLASLSTPALLKHSQGLLRHHHGLETSESTESLRGQKKTELIAVSARKTEPTLIKVDTRRQEDGKKGELTVRQDCAWKKALTARQDSTEKEELTARWDSAEKREFTTRQDSAGRKQLTTRRDSVEKGELAGMQDIVKDSTAWGLVTTADKKETCRQEFVDFNFPLKRKTPKMSPSAEQSLSCRTSGQEFSASALKPANTGTKNVCPIVRSREEFREKSLEFKLSEMRPRRSKIIKLNGPTKFRYVPETLTLRDPSSRVSVSSGVKSFPKERQQHKVNVRRRQPSLSLIGLPSSSSALKTAASSLDQKLARIPTSLFNETSVPPVSSSFSDQPTGSNSQPTGSNSLFNQPTGSFSLFNQPTGSTSLFNQPTGSTSLFNQPTGSTSLFNQPTGSTSLFNQPTGSNSLSYQPTTGSTSLFNRPTGSALLCNQPATSSLFNKPPPAHGQFSLNHLRS